MNEIARSSTTTEAALSRDETPDDRALGEVGVSGVATATLTTLAFSEGNFGALPFEGVFAALLDHAEKAQKGDTANMRGVLASQALALNAIFAELARRAATNMGSSLPATESYMRLALKAQSQSRASIEALDRLINGREQTVRHVHVDNRGGQAVIADNVHVGGQRNAKVDKQPHATVLDCGSVNTPLRGKNTNRKPVPIERNG